MRLMLRARFLAACHELWNIRNSPKHRIWRTYRWFGLETISVFYTCGKEFK